MSGKAASILGALLVAALGAPVAGSAADPPVVEIQASKQGFRPRTVSLRRGESVRIVLSSADGQHCFAVDELRIEKRVVAGRETAFELTPERPGRLPFYCCLEKERGAEVERGELVVTE